MLCDFLKNCYIQQVTTKLYVSTMYLYKGIEYVNNITF